MADSETTLHVDNLASTCTDSGTGTEAAPFCSIQLAANVATAGDAVLIVATFTTCARLVRLTFPGPDLRVNAEVQAADADDPMWRMPPIASTRSLPGQLPRGECSLVSDCHSE